MRILPGVLFPCLLAQAPMGKRPTPLPVAPVTSDGITYRALNADPRRGTLVAERTASGEQLWKVTVFETKLEPGLEADVQSVAIVRLSLRGRHLEVRDAEGRVFRVDLKTRAVRRRK